MFIVFYHQMYVYRWKIQSLKMGGKELLKKTQLHTEKHITHNAGKG